MMDFVGLFFYFFIFFSVVSCSSDIGTFRDSTCSKSLDNYRGPNGYPDGTCTALHLERGQAFSVVGLDPGCSVTIYGNNSDPALPCSSETKIVAQLAQCYNSSWIYYSIDGCDLPSTLPSSSSSSATPSSTQSAVTPPLPTAESRTSNSVVIGGVIGGVSCFTLVILLLLYFLRRHYIQSKSCCQDDELPPPPAYELSEDRALQELEYPKAACHAKVELYAHEHAAEIGRNSKYFSAVELEGDMLADWDKKGFNPGIRVHLVP